MALKLILVLPMEERQSQTKPAMASIHFLPDDRIIEVNEGESILQASLRAGIPHTHVCGGKARCTTCRIMVVEGDLDVISAPTENESYLANKLGFPLNIRLACQAYISGDIKSRRLVIDDDDLDMSLAKSSVEGEGLCSSGMEKEVAILFSDIRDFTSFSDRQLPYDIIHMLNRYFHRMRQIIERNHGQIYNYMGDGLLALFDADDPSSAMENGIRCGLEMLQAMDDMQPYLERTYNQGLQIGIGLHSGEVVIGTIDDNVGNKKMVIGDAVNFASRVESANREAGTRFLVSQPVFEKMENKIETGCSCSLEIKGKPGEHKLYEVMSIS